MLAIYSYAFINGFKVLRTDRGAVEFVKTRGGLFKWNKGILAFTLGQFIFWPSKRAATNMSRRPVCLTIM